MHECPWARYLASLNPSLTLINKKIKSLSFSFLPNSRAVAPLVSEITDLVLSTCHLLSLPPFPFLSPQSWCYFKLRLPAKICTLLITRQLLCVMFNAFSRLYQIHSEGKSLCSGCLAGWVLGGGGDQGPAASVCLDSASVKAKPRSDSQSLFKEHTAPHWKVGKPASLGRAKGLRTAEIICREGRRLRGDLKVWLGDIPREGWG